MSVPLAPPPPPVSLTLPLDPVAVAAVAKISLVLLTGLSVHLSLSPPNPPVPPKHCIDRRTLFERGVLWVTFCSKMMVWAETAFDALATTTLAFPALPGASLLASLLCPGAPHALLSPSPLLLAGTLATLLGALLRLACFRTLGPLFTFELAISPTHALVTNGPYALVRHPSYAGVYLTLLGASAVALAPGAWLRECWLQLQLRPCTPAALLSPVIATNSSTSTSTRADALLSMSCARSFGPGAFVAYLLLGLWAAKVVYALRSTHRRLATEDSELRRAFGPAWTRYAERVRWRLVPGVY